MKTIGSVAVALVLGILLAGPVLAQEETTTDEPAGAGPSTEIGPAGSSERNVDASDIQAPDGYQVEPVAEGLTYATSIAFSDNGEMYVGEAGGHTYGTSPENAPPPAS